MEQPLSGKRVAVLVETEYIYDEIEYYRKRIPELGGEVTFLAYLWGKPSMDFVNDIDSPDRPATDLHRLTVDQCVTKHDPNHFDVVVCAANYVAVRLREIPPMGSLASPDQTRTAPAVEFFARAMENKRIVKGAMCHALWILTPRPDLLKGRRVICHTVVLADIHNAGATYVPDPSHVVVDGDLVTARSFADIEPYFNAIVSTAASRPAEPGRKRVLVIASNYGFWGEELQAPWDAVKNAGHDVTLATPQGLKPLPIAISIDPDFVDPIQKYHVNPPQVCDRVKELLASGAWDNPIKLADVRAENYDAIVIAGGPGADLDLTNNPALHELILNMARQGKVVAAMCFGVAALAFARDPKNSFKSVVYGKSVTAHPRAWDFLANISYDLYEANPANPGTNVITPGFLLPVQDLMTDAVGPEGAVVSDPTTSREKPSVVADYPFVTGCSVESSIAFGRKIVEVLAAGHPGGSRYFPNETHQELGGLDQIVYSFERTHVLFTPVAVGKAIELHHHVAAQIGMSAEGSYEMHYDTTCQEIFPLQNVCNVQPNVTHGAPSPAKASFTSLDVKLDEPGALCLEGQGGFLQAGYEEPLGEGCFGRKIDAPWFSVFFLRLPPAAKVSLREAGTVIGIPMSGKYSVAIDQQRKIRERFQPHFCPAGLACDLDNPFREEVVTVIVTVRG
jgi:putative intracellular protease/amidase